MDKMAFYELEELLDSIKILNNKEEEERQKKEKTESSKVPNLNINSLTSQLSRSSGPSFPSQLKFWRASYKIYRKKEKYAN